MRRIAVYLLLSTLLVAAVASPALGRANPKPFGMVYAATETYRTFGVPANVPDGTGNDNIAAFTNGVAGQLSVSEVAPGEPGYNGGRWAVHTATWTADATPVLITDWETLQAFVAAGDVVLTRMPADDFRCPLLPGNSG